MTVVENKWSIRNKKKKMLATFKHEVEEHSKQHIPNVCAKYG